MAVKRRNGPTRLMIVNAGTKLYLENGFSNTTNMHICKLLDISTGQFTFHFPTKEHLLSELVRELCDFQWNCIEHQVAEGRTSLLAVCLELAAMAAICEDDPSAKDFYISTYTNPMTLAIIRKNDVRKAQAIFREYCPDWILEDFVRTENVVSGIEYGTLATESENTPLDQRVSTALDSIMKLYQVPEEIRKMKIEKVLAMDYRTIGSQILSEFKHYVEQVNEQALEEALHKKE